MLLTDYKPVSKLVLPKTLVDRPKFPVIDAHDHLGEWFGDWSKRPIQQLLDLLDEANVKVYVDLDGGWGEDILNAHLDAFKNVAPERTTARWAAPTSTSTSPPTRTRRPPP